MTARNLLRTVVVVVTWTMLTVQAAIGSAAAAGPSVDAAHPQLRVICPPTVAVTAGGTWASYVPQNAFDCNLQTEWNSDLYSDTIVAQFTHKILFSGIVLTAEASPPTEETYTIFGSNDGTTWIQLAKASSWVSSTTGVTLAPVLFEPGAYAYLRIAVQGDASWVDLHEVRLIVP